MNLKRRAVTILDEVYACITSFLLFIIVKPVLKFSKAILSRNNYVKVNYFFIDLTNKIYIRNKLLLQKLNDAKVDLRIYRDTYDCSGLESYTKLIPAKILFYKKSIMDFGCGPGGKCAEMLKHDPKKVLGIDLSSRNIKVAKELITESNHHKLFFQKKDILSFKQDSVFDTIVSYTVFEHIQKGSLLKILKKMNQLIKKNGNILIAFNHYNDKFGSHLKEYIYHPWPQMLFDEDIMFEYWNECLNNDKNVSKNSYYPKNYIHGVNKHNHDCLMNLNKVSIEEFEEIISQSGLRYIKKDQGTRFKILRFVPFLPKKYLSGSCIYHLQKG